MQHPVVSYEERAELPQASKRSFFDLRNFRKHRNVLFSICGTSASAKTFFFRFAELPQASKRPLFDLRNFRKRFSVCRNPFDQSSYSVTVTLTRLPSAKTSFCYLFYD